MNIAIIGYRGTGKTSVARDVAERTGLHLISIDRIIEQQYGPIPEIVDAHGWKHFREYEAQALHDQLSNQAQDAVVDCGGGIVLRPDNVDLLKRTSTVYWLTAPLDILRHRLSNDNIKRPALHGDCAIQEMQEVLKQRLPLYEAAADHVIDTANCSTCRPIKEIVSDIISLHYR